MSAVPGFLDKIDTYPGLASDLAAKGSSMEEVQVRCRTCHSLVLGIVIWLVAHLWPFNSTIGFGLARTA